MISIETPKKKAGRISICILISALIFIAFPAWSADYYIAQSAVGSRGGSSCANAKAVTWNWTSPTVIGDDTVHLCGTITSQLAIAKSGTSGHPITVKFESGAKFSNPYWSIFGGIIALGTNSNLVIDGNNVGIIEATSNGSVDKNEVRYGYGDGISGTGSNIEIKNLTIRNLYVHTFQTSTNDGGPAAGMGIVLQGDNIKVHDCTISYNNSGITHVTPTGATTTGLYIYNNNISGCCWGISPSTGNPSVSTKSVTRVHDNNIEMGANWMSSGGYDCHLNGIFSYGDAYSAKLDDYQIYNNYIHGPASNPGGVSSGTAYIHIEAIDVGSSTKVYNNLLVGNAYSVPANGFIAEYYTHEVSPQVINNTIIGTGNDLGILFGYSTGGNLISKNNIFSNLTQAYVVAGSNTVTGDNNAFYNVGVIGIIDGVYSQYLSDWKTYLGGCPGTGKDCNSLTSNPNLNASYTPKDTSPVGGKGVNLTSLGITALNSDKSGVARPVSGAWDIGAYAYGYNKPKPPRNLRIN